MNKNKAPADILKALKQSFSQGKTRSMGSRKSLLNDLYRAVKAYEAPLMQALAEDLGKSDFEGFSNEIGIVYNEISHSRRRLRRWMRPRRVVPDLHILPGKGQVIREPFGTCLIIAPWNFPVQLLLSPLIGALAAGNTVILKPSELSRSTAKVLTEMIEEYFDPALVAVVNGGPEVTTALLQLPLDYIFFTGSVPVGKIVMEAAAKQLIPLTLELGGKSPAIVTPSADLEPSVRRLAMGKFLNAGQVCVAPDYALVHRSVYPRFLELLKKTVREFYGEIPRDSGQFGRIINQRHFDRICAMLTPKDCLFGGETDREQRYIAPSAYGPLDWNHPLMEDEIFGPVLPIILYDDLDKTIEQIRSRPKPLALYVFSRNKEEIGRVTGGISFGGGGINTTILHVASSKLPFGGVGPSGIGRYHGEHSFDCFSHQKSLLKQPTRPDLGLAYPHKSIPLKLVKKILK